MKEIEVEDNQLLLDIALQYYGTAEAAGEIIRNNPGLRNETAAVIATGRAPGPFYPDIKLDPGSTVEIDDQSRLSRRTAVKDLGSSITTYIEAQWQEQYNR